MPQETELSAADTALLALLCEGPMHPWQIEKTVQERDMRFWTDLSQSTIYKQLRALERKGYVACQEEIEGGRLRKVYSAAKPGRAALEKRLLRFLSEPEHLKYRVDLATYNVDLLPKAQALAGLKRYRKELEKGIEGYRKLEAYLDSEDCPPHRRAVARRPIHLLEGELGWVDEFIARLKRA